MASPFVVAVWVLRVNRAISVLISLISTTEPAIFSQVSKLFGLCRCICLCGHRGLATMKIARNGICEHQRNKPLQGFGQTACRETVFLDQNRYQFDDHPCIGSKEPASSTVRQGPCELAMLLCCSANASSNCRLNNVFPMLDQILCVHRFGNLRRVGRP